MLLLYSVDEEEETLAEAAAGFGGKGIPRRGKVAVTRTPLEKGSGIIGMV